jgi:class 3 adenylate cyclase/tetratricopeptide (TPR) repeat protein
VTILFSDLSGYTALSEKLDPEELKEFTGALFGSIAGVIGRYGGFVEKYIGDAVMGVFGVPSAHEDDPVRAVRAGREIHQLVARPHPLISALIGYSLSAHTGINTGLVVTGQIDAGKGTHGIAGDTVNVASRLCGLAQPGEIVVGSETWQQAEGSFDFEELPPAPIKGKEESLRVFKVLSPKEKPLTVHRISGVRARLTGRDAEMAELRDAATKLTRGEGAVISVCGDAGTGKSRLIEEFKATLDLGHTRWLEGRAYLYAQNTAFSLLTDLVNHACDIEEGDTPDRVKAKLEKRILDLTGDGSSIIPYVGSLYSLHYPELEEVTPERWKFLLGNGIRETLNALSQRSPLVIAMEDLHWADPSSLELLRSLLTDTRFPSLFVFAYRPPFGLFTGDESAALGTSYREIRLHDLSPSESLQMLRSLLDTQEVPRDLQRFFQERIQGNPFYLEEVVNGLVDSGTLVRTGNEWKLTKGFDEVDLSSGIHGVIGARLDQLETEAKRILQEASVIGRSFLFEILRRITALADQCERCVSGLERRDFIRAKALEPDLEYIFKHALTQEVVYNGLLKKDRREIHERVARVMEAFFQQRLPEFYEILAYHYARGESPLKAVEYLMRSGEKSLARYAVAEAHQYYEQAYRIISAKDPRTKADSISLIDILTNWAYAFYYLGDFKRLTELLALHENEAASIDDETKKAMFYAWFGWALWGTGRFKGAHEYLMRAKGIAERLGERRVLGHTYTWLSWTCGMMGTFEEGLEAAGRAMEIAQSFPSDQYLSFKGLAGAALVHMLRGDLEAARRDSRALLDYGRRQSNNRSLVLGYFMQGNINLLVGDAPSATGCYEKAIEAARDPLYVIFSRTYMGGAYVLAGRLVEAEKELASVIDFHERFDVGFLAGSARLYLALAKIVKGRFGEGLKELAAIGDDARESGNMFLHLLALRYLGEVYLRVVEGGGPRSLAVMARNIPFLIANVPFADNKAQECIKKVIRVSEETGARLQLGQAYLNLGLLHKAKKRRDKAKESLSEAVRVLGECGADADLGRAKEALALLG